ncbi:hypothetical protein [Paenibacillus timonensis]|uniref:hypothetical protein n=1 Tax=Paenibacillus timonensis TaxID=225915 RepID=UPI003F98890A
MRRTRLLSLILSLFLLIVGCSNNTETDDGFNLHDIYSYEYNSIESKHHDLITKWMNESRQSEYPISYHSISNDQDQFGYEYIYAKGYKEFEITFVYSTDSMGPKGSLYIVGIKGETDDEILVKIKYDPKYVLGTISSDQSILSKNKEL